MRNRGWRLGGIIVAVAVLGGAGGCDLDDTRSPSNPPPSAPTPPPPAPQTPPKAAGRVTVGSASAFVAPTIPPAPRPV